MGSCVVGGWGAWILEKGGSMLLKQGVQEDQVCSTPCPGLVPLPRKSRFRREWWSREQQSRRFGRCRRFEPCRQRSGAKTATCDGQ